MLELHREPPVDSKRAFRQLAAEQAGCTEITSVANRDKVATEAEMLMPSPAAIGDLAR
jgi:hypothetical protein